MTMRQVQIAVERISTRDHNAYALQASLFGHKIKPLETNKDIEELDLDEGEEKALEQAMNDALKSL